MHVIELKQLAKDLSIYDLQELCDFCNKLATLLKGEKEINHGNEL